MVIVKAPAPPVLGFRSERTGREHMEIAQVDTAIKCLKLGPFLLDSILHSRACDQWLSSPGLFNMGCRTSSLESWELAREAEFQASPARPA